MYANSLLHGHWSQIPSSNKFDLYALTKIHAWSHSTRSYFYFFFISENYNRTLFRICMKFVIYSLAIYAFRTCTKKNSINTYTTHSESISIYIKPTPLPILLIFNWIRAECWTYSVSTQDTVGRILHIFLQYISLHKCTWTYWWILSHQLSTRRLHLTLPFKRIYTLIYTVPFCIEVVIHTTVILIYLFSSHSLPFFLSLFVTFSLSHTLSFFTTVFDINDIYIYMY